MISLAVLPFLAFVPPARADDVRPLSEQEAVAALKGMKGSPYDEKFTEDFGACLKITMPIFSFDPFAAGPPPKEFFTFSGQQKKDLKKCMDIRGHANVDYGLNSTDSSANPDFDKNYDEMVKSLEETHQGMDDLRQMWADLGQRGEAALPEDYKDHLTTRLTPRGQTVSPAAVYRFDKGQNQDHDQKGDAGEDDR